MAENFDATRVDVMNVSKTHVESTAYAVSYDNRNRWVFVAKYASKKNHETHHQVDVYTENTFFHTCDLGNTGEHVRHMKTSSTGVTYALFASLVANIGDGRQKCDDASRWRTETNWTFGRIIHVEESSAYLTMLADNRLKLVRCDYGLNLYGVTPVFTAQFDFEMKGVGTSLKHVIDGVARTLMFVAIDKYYVVRVEVDTQSDQSDFELIHVAYDTYIDAVTTRVRNDGTESALFLARVTSVEYVVFEIRYEDDAVIVNELLTFDAQAESGYVLHPKKIRAFDVDGNGLMDIAVEYVNTNFELIDADILDFRTTNQSRNNIEVFINSDNAFFDKNVRVRFPFRHLVDIDSFSDELVALEYNESTLTRLKMRH
eukprot:gene200-348_t